jgi:hypothetical protein
VLLPFLYLPGVPHVGEVVYESVARHRHSTGCAVAIKALARFDIAK